MRSCICAGIHFFYSSCFRKTIISSHKYKLMKQLKYLIYLLTLVFALYSCSSGDDSNNGDGSGTTAEEVNTNRNIVTTDAAVARLEFPKLKGGNSIVLVNRTTGDKQYDRDEGLESHAYEFIHTSSPEEIFGMKFDVIVGNPPYQLSDGGGSGTSAAPLYHKFVQQAIKLKPDYLVMIVPSRWFSGGKGLDEFRSQMLHDDRLKEIHDFIEASDCFPGVQIKGGVCYFLWDRQYHGDCTIFTHRNGKVGAPMTRPLLEQGNDVLIRFNEAIPIFHKVSSATKEPLSTLVSARRPFGLSSTFRGHEERRANDYVLYQSGGRAYVSKEDISDNGCAEEWKVFIPFLGPGNDNFPHMVLGKPFVGKPGEVCTETCLTIGPLKSLDECLSLISYISTRFFRFMVLLKKPSQNATKRVYDFVPLVSFDRKWTDGELNLLFGITEEESAFIASLVKDMTLEAGSDD